MVHSQIQYASKCGGNASSREMDKKQKLHDHVRLSFNASHPMMYVCRKDGRVLDPVVLVISILAANLPDVRFSDSNANSFHSKLSRNPKVVRFDTALLPSQFHALEEDRPFFRRKS